jgi:hypothetical protein
VTTPTAHGELTALHELPPGTGRVHAVVRRAGETLLTLGYPGDVRVVVALPKPARDDAKADGGLRGGRPVAVRMTNRHGSLECSVLVTSRIGPRRLPISTALALRLSAMGVHAVLCTT